MAIPSFVDRVKFTVAAGNGGNGCVSVLREKFRPLGGPDGGNGGDGGSIIFRVDEGLTTLLEFHRQSIRRAPNGEPGKGDMKHGARGEDMILEVPSGTIVTDLGTGEQLADLTEHGEEFVAAQGGRGGLGNAALANAQRKAPGFALLGEEGDERLVQLELKFVADVGLVGFPSAGKSSLIAAISRARPKIADYPFTTLVPNLGVVQAGDVTYTVADVPGLIEGASEGRGLGFDFLRHIDRCHALVHIIDLATYEPGRDPVGDLEIIEGELTAHGGLENRPRLIALNKVDLPDAPEMADIVRPDLERFGHPVFAISTKTGEGLNELKFAMAEIVEKRRSEIPAAEPKPVIRPTPVGRAKNVAEFEIVKKGDGEGGFVWRVTGEKPERWVKQTDFNNGEAVGFLSDRLGKIGIEAKLLDLGAQAGDAVAIGGEDPVVFDFAPQIESGAELLSRRGDDHRLDTQRPAVTRRRVKDAEYHAAREAGVDYMVEGLPEEDDES